MVCRGPSDENESPNRKNPVTITLYLPGYEFMEFKTPRTRRIPCFMPPVKVFHFDVRDMNYTIPYGVIIG